MVYNIRASPPTTIYPSFSLTSRSFFIWRACRRSMSFSLIAASDGREGVAPMVFVLFPTKTIVVEARFSRGADWSWSCRKMGLGTGQHGMPRRLSYLRMRAPRHLSAGSLHTPDLVFREIVRPAVSKVRCRSNIQLHSHVEECLQSPPLAYPAPQPNYSRHDNSA